MLSVANAYTERVRYIYSTVQFVPNFARGEFVNVGVVAGSDETGEWDARRIHNIGRAAAFGGRGSEQLITGIFEWVDLDALPHLRARRNKGHGERWLSGQAARCGWSYAQVTSPIPMVANSLQDALDKAFDIKVADVPATIPVAV